MLYSKSNRYIEDGFEAAASSAGFSSMSSDNIEDDSLTLSLSACSRSEQIQEIVFIWRLKNDGNDLTCWS